MKTYVIRFTKNNSFLTNDLGVPDFFSLSEANFFLLKNNIKKEFELIDSSEIKSIKEKKRWKVIWTKTEEIIWEQNKNSL